MIRLRLHCTFTQAELASFTKFYNHTETKSNSISRVEMAQSALIRLLPLVTCLAMGHSAIEPGAITPNQVGTCDPADCSSTCQCDPSGRTGDCICSWDVWFFVLVLGAIVALSGTIRCIVSLCRRRDYVAVMS